MQHTQEFNSLAFIMQGGFVSISVVIILLAMSVASWYFVVIKTVQYLKLKRAINNDIAAIWAPQNMQFGSLQLGLGKLEFSKAQAHSPAYQLAAQAVEANQHYQIHVMKKVDGSCTHDEFIVRSMRRSLASTQAQLESGLSVLASVGSVAPFVGLFGTVWGIYHALASISASGQATLDKVAGPVGEALIMTAIGLAVAIPAVLAYNAFVKSNRNTLAHLESFAEDLRTLLTTGAALKSNATNTAIQANQHEVAHNTAGVPA